ncbi:MAG: zinc-dependent alcohol dehydrogenase, partial [Candidatus Lokiarchaeota archaeon]|nr:zinc-dependent alcohol dehydrogenase [Candidatus Lokiarchaeota archaeon]
MSSMKAAVLRDFNRLYLEDVPVPQAQNIGEVLVKIRSCGFCQTDY